MQRLQLVLPLCAMILFACPLRSWGQSSETATYFSFDAGVLRLNLPPFDYFQQVNLLGDHVRFLETDSGKATGALFGGKIGWTLYEPSTLCGPRIEARGFYSKRDIRIQQALPAGTVFNLLDASAGVQFPNPTDADYRRQVTVLSGDMLMKWDMANSNSLIVAPYAGFSVLDIDQRFDVTANDALAGIRMTLNERLQGSYYGGTAGIEVLCRLMPTTILSVDGGVSLFDFSATRQANQTNSLPAANIFLNQRAGDTAFAANLRVELSQELRWCQVVLFGGAQYLDTVPTVTYGRILNAATTIEPSRFTISDAWGFTGGVSLRIPF